MMKTASELLSYLEKNSDVAMALGVDVTNPTYQALSGANKVKFMAAVWEKLTETVTAE